MTLYGNCAHTSLVATLARSPMTTTRDCSSRARIWDTKPARIDACCARCTSEERAGGWLRPNRGWSPPCGRTAVGK